MPFFSETMIATPVLSLLLLPLSACYAFQANPQIRIGSLTTGGRFIASSTLAKSTDEDTANEVSFLKKALEGAVRQISGETEYEIGLLHDRTPQSYYYRLGDLTNAILAEFGIGVSRNETLDEPTDTRQRPTLEDMGQSAAVWREETFRSKDLPVDIMEIFFSRLTEKQRVNLILLSYQCGAEAIVLWGLVSNLCTLIAASMAWLATLSSQSLLAVSPIPVLPLLPVCAPQALWRAFVAKYVGFNLVLSPLFLIVRAIGTLVGFRKFHSYVTRFSTTEWIAREPFRKYRSTVLNKCVALITLFFMLNVVVSALAAGTTFAGIGMCARLFHLIVRAIYGVP